MMPCSGVIIVTQPRLPPVPSALAELATETQVVSILAA